MASNEWLVRKLHEQDKKIEALSRGGTGVGYSSIAPGENLTVISEDGEVVLGAGGVEHVDGPTPATPSAPALKLGFGTIETTWDGSFAEGEDEDGVSLTAPVDFDVVEVHCSTDPEEEEWGEDTMRGQIKTREGGTITVGGFDVDDEVFVCLIALAKTGKRSGPSATASLVIEGLDFAQLTNELDAATVTIGNAREVLLDGQNTLGEKLDAADTALSDLETTLDDLDSTTLPALRSDLDAAEGRLSTAEGQITDAFGELGDAFSQIDAIPGQIDSAKDAAISTAASDATQKALDALADARLYADQQDATTLTAAEQAAQDKADAAQAAAEAKAADAQQTADTALAAINAGESMWLDPGFEASFGPVASTDPAVVRSTEFAYQGAYSLKYTTDGGGSWINPGYIYVDVTPGRVYRLSAAVRSDDGLQALVWLHQYDSSGALVPNTANHLSVQGVAGEWVLGSNITTADSATAQFRIAPHIPAASNSVAGQKLFLDNFSLTDITSGYEQYKEALLAAQEAQQTAGEAKAIAESAVSAAEGGNTNFYSTSSPSGVGSLVGDLWYKQDSTGAVVGLWHWDGTNWLPQVFNNEVFGDISANKITFGTMSGARIEAGSLTIGATAGLDSELASKATPGDVSVAADAAQSAAEATAAADATAKANTAKSDAISTAASDATTKANQAAQSAVTTAAANANTQYGETKSLVSGWKRAGTTKIDGGTIATGTVYADSIVSGLSQNMVPDPGLTNPTITATRLGATNNFGATWSVSNGSIFCDAASLTGTPNFPLVSSSDNYAWAAYPSMKVALRVRARMVTGTGGLRWTIRFRRRDGSTALVTGVPNGFQSLGSVWSDVEATYSFPADVAGFTAVLQLSSATSGRAELTAPFAASSVGTTVIEQGAVTTDRLAANVLEVGNLKAGVAAIAEAVVQKIAASTASIQQADVKNLFVTGTSSLSNVVAERIASETAKFIELEVGNLVAGTGAMDTATINKLFTDVVVASMATAQEFIGENAILTGAVTASKITASEELWAKIAEFVKIRAEHIESDAIDGMVITGPNIRTSASGARVQMDPNGVRVFNADNDVRTHLSPDGSTFKGEVEAETLVVNDGAEFKANNTLAQGSKLTLAAGVTDPTAPPVVQPYWDGLEFTSANINGSNPVGLAWDGTNYITVGANRATSSVAAYFTGVYAMKINGETGEASRLRCDFSAASGPESRVSEVFGVTCIGSDLFFLGRYGYAGYVWVTDLAGGFKRRFSYPELGYESGGSPLVYRPGIGNDGTNVVIAQCDDAGLLRIRIYNKTTGARTAQLLDNGSTRSDITGVYVGNADWGRNLATVGVKRTSELLSFNSTTGVYDGDGTKFNAAATGSTGVVFVDGKFRTLDPSGVIHEYADTTTGDNSGDWWATYYWYTDVNGNNVIESSDYRSRMAPPARFKWPRRAMLKILGQPMPTGVEALGPALAKKTTTPVRTDFSGPPWSVDAGKPSARYTELPANWTTYASPSDENTYPESESSALETASGTFKLKGDGSGHWGPLKMGRNGIMSGLIVTGQTVCKVDTAGQSKKFTVQLPAGRFTKPPVVWAINSTTVPQDVAVSVRWEDVRTTSFDLWYWRKDLTANGVIWFAMDSE